MTRTTASQLQIGDVFYREIYRPPDPEVDWRYTVRSIQHVPLRDFFGAPLERIEITADSHLTGPQRISLGPDDPVWVVDRVAVGELSDGAGRPGRSRRWGPFGSRSRRRRPA